MAALDLSFKSILKNRIEIKEDAYFAKYVVETCSTIGITCSQGLQSCTGFDDVKINMA